MAGLITSLSPGNVGKLSKFAAARGGVAGMLDRFGELQRKTQAPTPQQSSLVTIQEAGLGGFWTHRVLENEGIASHVVGHSTSAVARRKLRVKTGRIDREMLTRSAGLQAPRERW